MSNQQIDTNHLPGNELVEQGLKDLEAGLTTVHSLLLLEASPALERLGFNIKHIESSVSYKHALYALLEEEQQNAAYSLYNSMMRRISSFIHALENS